MRQTLMLATMAIFTACGATGDVPWDENRDGLITACEGLNPRACDATVGCEPAPIVCTAICIDDGHGGCRPCVGEETCRPTPTPLPFDCGQLSLVACAADARCVVAAQADDLATGGAGFSLPAPRRAGICVNRPPTPCEQLTPDVCLARPGCALETLATTDAACFAECDSAGNCRCATPPMPSTRCVTLPPPDVCAHRDPNVCSIDGRCVLEPGVGVCETFCAPGGNCSPCAPPSAPRCVPVTPVDECGARDANVCSIDGRCVLEAGPVCDVACAPDGSCPPCANPTVRCVPVTPIDHCGSRDLNACEVDGRCVVQAWACPAICKPDGNGGCEPCDAPPIACVPAPVPDECGSRDLASCSLDGRCQVESWACPAVCIDDGNGGCLPCNAPPDACVPVQPVDRCEGLDRFTCGAVGCTVIELACTLECRDDGQGGCLPCDAFVCSSGGDSGSGGGSVPPRP